MPDKPARYITKLTDQLAAYKVTTEQDAARLAQMAVEAAELRAELSRYVALDLARQQDIETIKCERDQAREKIAGRTKTDDALHAEMTAAIGVERATLMREDPVAFVAKIMSDAALSLIGQATKHEYRVAEMEARIAELEARGPELDAREIELRAMVERVQDRMRRDERDKANAILNRKALAGVVPGLRRR